MKRTNKTSRRQFIKTASAATVGAISLPYFVPASALGLQGKAAPSDRIVMAWIGAGGRGQSLINAFIGFKDVQIVAVCDVDKRHMEEGKKIVDKAYGNSDCKTNGDFREIAGLKDIDAVCIATPDHWHALTSIACLKAGKDVYCEKPLTNTVVEGRAICNALKAIPGGPRILQCGSHERSTNTIRLACEQVRNGKIGKVHTVRINLPTTDGHHKKVMVQKDPAPEMPVPEALNYDLWLGHTPFR
ncbi:MAG: Gfo/Idh/MocA family oxidoreductase, partial [Planctomycetia bacterium]|nr:Gfo/Idh/MocA family oxidoreductase [Planctomycetia bacterium]